jgi:hypothetical protein
LRGIKLHETSDRDQAYNRERDAGYWHEGLLNGDLQESSIKHGQHIAILAMRIKNFFCTRLISAFLPSPRIMVRRERAGLGARPQGERAGRG